MVTNLYTVRWPLAANSVRLSMNLSQKSLCNGRSIFFNVSLVDASMLTYNCVTGFMAFIASGN